MKQWFSDTVNRQCKRIIFPEKSEKNEGIFMIALAYFLKGQNFQAAAQ